MFDLNFDDNLFLFVDFQEKLMPAMNEAGEVIKNAKRAYEFSKLCDIPYIFTTQYKRGLGGLVEVFRCEDENVFDKSEFSCYKNAEIKNAIDNSNIKNIILLGQEAHICIFQTARDLLKAGYNVFLVADAVTSRTCFNKENGLQVLRYMGANVVNLELVIFDILKDSKSPRFKAAQALIK